MKLSALRFFLAGSLVVKFLLAYFVPVFGDEAYYYIWSLHPQLSYFDHPAMVSWFIYLGHLFLPAGHPISLRFVFIIASFLTSLLWIKILRMRNQSESSILFCMLLLLLNPLLGPGSVLATPDTPLVLFWSLSYFSFLKVLEAKSYSWYVLLGVFLGLGFCSKYHVVLFVLSGLIYLLMAKKITSLRWRGILLTTLTGALFSLPVLIWNAKNQWSSFLFQLNHGFGENTFEWDRPTGYIIAQLLVVNPIIFFWLFKPGSGLPDKTFSLTQLTFFFTSSFRSVVEGNWPLTSHLHSISHFGRVAARKQWSFAVLYWLAFYFLAALFFMSPASLAVKKNLVNSSHLNDMGDIVANYQPLYGPSYQVASLLSWKYQKNIPKLEGLSRHDFYDSLPESAPTEASFFVLKYDNSEWPEKYEYFKKIKIQSFDNRGFALYQFTYE